MQPTASDEDRLGRITTGIERLDGVLHGGIPRYSTVFVAGLPGTGKTILSQQALFAAAKQGSTGLYLSTVSEPPIKVLRFLQGFRFFDPQLFGRQVVYGELGSSLRQGGVDASLRHLDELVRQHRPALVVIDSFKVLRDTISDPLAFREFTSDLAIRFAAWEATALLVGEYAAQDIHTGAEFAIADGILYLYGTEEPERQRRYLRVMKMRGTPYFSGEHFFEIGADGLTLYPRFDPIVATGYGLLGGRLGSAVEGLSEMLGGGIFEGTCTLITGSAGTGKTLLALAFLVDAARRGIPGLLVSFEASPQQICRNGESFCWDLADLIARGLIDIVHVSPSELNVDRHAFAIMDRAGKLAARLVAIDSISAFEAAVSDPARYQGYLWAINDHFKRTGAAVIMTQEAPDAWTPFATLPIGVSFIADNAIFLRYVELEGMIGRTVGVLKMRDSGHDRAVRELLIEPPRIAAGAPVRLAQLAVAERLSPKRRRR